MFRDKNDEIVTDFISFDWEKEYSRMTFFEKSDEQKFVELLQRIHCLERDIDALARLFYSTHCLDK